ncbi:MAG: RagB/SusD family nutrient uptake outer membrane protein, partial [Spirosomataceae bacterium]
SGDYVVRSTGEVHHTEFNYHEKYLDPVNGPLNYNNHSTNMPLIRYADVLLSYSEAINAINGPTAEAYYGLNRIRTRAGLEPLSGLSKEAFFEEIVMERARELFCEGVRWFDLKRWGLLKRAEDRGETGVNIEGIRVVLPKHSVFPFPQREIDANPNLKQNPGY